MPVDKNDWEIWALRGCRVTICKEPVSGKTQSHFDQLKDEDCYVYNINPESLVGLTQPSNVQGPDVLPDDIPFMRTRNLPTGFDKNVVSMRIDGPCMVALFGDKLKTGNNDWEDKGDDRVKNEIFGPGDGEYPVYMNLLAKEGDTGYRNHHLIGTCESGKLGFGSKTRSCASAIAIFPLK